jgi:hypothetical protein
MNNISSDDRIDQAIFDGFIGMFGGELDSWQPGFSAALANLHTREFVVEHSVGELPVIRGRFEWRDKAPWYLCTETETAIGGLREMRPEWRSLPVIRTESKPSRKRR